MPGMPGQAMRHAMPAPPHTLPWTPTTHQSARSAVTRLNFIEPGWHCIAPCARHTDYLALLPNIVAFC